MRILFVIAHSLDKGTPNQYAYHFVLYLGRPEVSDLILLIG